jgi:arginyl-tRNA synthetase
MTKLNGDTGLYIQYTAVRLRSLLERLTQHHKEEKEIINTDSATML